jgi:hypothetical protein
MDILCLPSGVPGVNRIEIFDGERKNIMQENWSTTPGCIESLKGRAVHIDDDRLKNLIGINDLSPLFEKEVHLSSSPHYTLYQKFLAVLRKINDLPVLQ